MIKVIHVPSKDLKAGDCIICDGEISKVIKQPEPYSVVAEHILFFKLQELFSGHTFYITLHRNEDVIKIDNSSFKKYVIEGLCDL